MTMGMIAKHGWFHIIKSKALEIIAGHFHNQAPLITVFHGLYIPYTVISLRCFTGSILKEINPQGVFKAARNEQRNLRHH